MGKRICYYISDYGYGHATRSIAIIRKLLACDSQIHIIICTSFSINFIKESLVNEEQNRISYRHVKNDIGYFLQDTSIEIDKIKMQEEYKKFLSAIPRIINEESTFFQQESIDLIISDISPLPFLLSKKYRVPSVGISNFTWYTAYEEIVSKEELAPLHRMYQQMDYFLPLAGALEPDWGETITNSQEYFCREINENEVSRLKQEIKGDKNPFIVYFGLGMKIDSLDLSNLKLWKSENCTFIVSSNTPITGPNVIKIPENYTESQNYIAVSELVISKAGWSTISEAIQLEKPLILLDRQRMREDRLTIDYLASHNRCKLLSWKELQHFEITDQIQKELKNQITSSQLGRRKNEEILGNIIKIIKSIMDC